MLNIIPHCPLNYPNQSQGVLPPLNCYWPPCPGQGGWGGGGGSGLPTSITLTHTCRIHTCRDSTPTMKSGLQWRVWKKICCVGVDAQVVVSWVDPLSAYSDLPWKSHDSMLLELQPASPMCI